MIDHKLPDFREIFTESLSLICCQLLNNEIRNYRPYVPWGHHIAIITKCRSVEEAVYYIRRTIEEGWSRSALENAIEADFYNVSGKAVSNFKEMLPAAQGQLAQEITKEIYDLGFIELPPKYDEEALESALERNITRFLLELGTGFVGHFEHV